MSNLKANKAVALEFIEALGHLDVERLLNCMTDDVIFETPGKYPMSGVKTRAQVAAEFPNMVKVLPDGLKFNILTTTAEDDRVHVEMIGEARTFDGGEYNNQYHYAFVIRDGKISRFRDYLDTWLSMKVLHRYIHD